MQWLIANMWMALAAAGVLGLLFGFSIRGLMVGGKIRRAQVERDVARTELEQSRIEVDALYADQRKRRDAGGDVAVEASGDIDGLRAELDSRDNALNAANARNASLRSELEAVNSDLEKAKQTALMGSAAGAVAGVIGGAVLGGDDDASNELKERNTWLEERVAALESDLEMAAIPTVAEAPAETVIATAATEANDLSLDKMKWQTGYLRQRVEALEGQIIAQPTHVKMPSVVIADDAVADDAEATEVHADAPALDEEMARLRWRNRYLEGRLAYYEEDGDAAADEEDASSGIVKGAIAATGAALVGGAALLSDNEDDQTEEMVIEEVVESSDDVDFETAEIEDVVDEASEADLSSNSDDFDYIDEPEVEEAAAKSTVAEEGETHPSEAVLAELGDDLDDTDDTGGVQPEQMSAPTGGGDDLTAIGGIGPRIAEVLNGLGIHTYAQIAAWEPENEVWIEEHLSFKGRVSRERWVEQAKVLIQTPEA
jgi:predicted flap endonuclease-1-like 5' DNA nuclease